MSREAGTMRHEATLETPGHPSGAEPVTITGTGPEVFSVAYGAYQSGTENGARVEMHFYVAGKEVPWRDIVASMDALAVMKSALSKVFTDAGLEELPF